MARSGDPPSSGALDEVRRLAGPSAAIAGAMRLDGGQHAETWKVDTTNPASTVVVRQFPVGDPAPLHEQRVLAALDGLGGLAPVLLGGDLDGRWSQQPTSLISWLDGGPDITPADPGAWARELGRALAAVHAVPAARLAELPSVFDDRGGSEQILGGPLAAEVGSRWSELLAAPAVLAHGDYWSGNVVWRDGKLTGIVDWSGASRGPRGFDLGWCRLDLVLLFDERIADEFLAAYQAAAGPTVGDVRLWDCWAAARPTKGSGPGSRTIGRWVAPTSMKRSCGGATRSGRRACGRGHRSREPFSRLRAITGMSENPTDAEAIAGSLTEPRRFGVIFERHFDSIHGYLRRRFDDQLADELTAQAFLVAFDQRARFDQQRWDARPWLFGIATNLAHRHRRSELRELRAIAAMAPDASTGIEGVEARVDAERLRSLLAQSLADLPAEESDVLRLLVWAELDQPEIAAALAIPLGTVKSRLSRARRRLQVALGLSPERRPAHREPSSPRR